MNILVTGGAGYIGTGVARQLHQEGHDVRIMDNLTYGGRQLLPLLNTAAFIIGDVRNRDDCARAVDGMDCVVHLAAIVGENACKEDPTRTWETNVLGTQNMYIAAKNAGVGKFIFSSTCSNYGQAGLATENTELRPLGEYALQKVEAEDWLKFQGDVMILRFSTAYGFSARMRLDLMIQEFVLDALTTGKLELYNPGAKRPFVHTHDISLFIGRAVWTPPEQGVYNIGGTNITKQELANEIAALTPVKITTREVGDQRDYSVCFKKAHEYFKFKPLRMPTGFIQEMISLWRKGIFNETVYVNSTH